MTSGWTEIRLRAVRGVFSFRGIFVAWLLLHGVSGAAQERPVGSVPDIRVEVARVNVGVIVTDARGNFVEGLQRDSFQIFEGTAPQPITDFASVEAPAEVLLLLEAGPAVYLLQDSHLFVASALLSGLAPGDRVAIATYNETATPILDYTADKSIVENALGSIQFNLGFGNLNLASSLNTALDWLAKIPGKKSVVLISSGVDTSPVTAMQVLLRRLETSDERIFAISMSGPLRHGKKGTAQQIQQTQQAFEQADTWLKTLADASGGRAYFPENAKAFQETYRQIAQLVRHEYSLAFAPPKADGATHPIDVKVISATKNGGPDYRVDHRRGYIAPKPTQ